jgi:hypothetical protein
MTHGAFGTPGTSGAHRTSETNRNTSFVNKTINFRLTSTKKSKYK